MPPLPGLFASAPLTMTSGFFTSRLQSRLDGGSELLQADFDGIAVGAEFEVGRERRLVGRGDAGEFSKLVGAGFFVEAFRVAALASFERGVDEDFDEFSRRQRGADGVALRAERRDERSEHDEASVGELLSEACPFGKTDFQAFQ